MTSGNGNGKIRAPRHLRPATRRWFRSVVSVYELEEHHLKILQAAGEAWDRLQAAREAIAKFGTVYTDRFGAPRMRPEVRIENDSRICFARLLRELALDAPPPGETRVPRIGGG